MLTKKNILKIIAVILGAIAAVAALIWIISKILPFFIGVIIFGPWLLAALANGAKI